MFRRCGKCGGCELAVVNKPRPIRREITKRLPVVRPSGLGKLVSGLQQQTTTAIGFVHQFDQQDSAEDDRKC